MIKDYVNESDEFADNISIMAEKDTFYYLKWTSFTADFSDDERRDLVPYFQQIRYNKGEKIFAEGTVGIGMGIILEGSAGIYIREKNELKKIAQVEKDETIGELALLDEEPRVANVIAEESVSLLVLTKPRFDKLLSEDSDMGCKFVLQIARILAKRIRSADMHLKQL